MNGLAFYGISPLQYFNSRFFRWERLISIGLDDGVKKFQFSLSAWRAII